MRINIPPTSAIYKQLRKLDTPEKIQDFLNLMPFNFEEKGETYRSVSAALESGTAHCFEGALIAAAALSLHGEKPLILDLYTAKKDVDHVIALFRKGPYWGAISKTNHAVLRYREPVYKSVRELVMSYFHEYFLTNGTKTLVSYSKPFNLRQTKFDWLMSKSNLAQLVEELDHSPHVPVVPKHHKLRKADRIEIEAGAIIEHTRRRPGEVSTN